MGFRQFSPHILAFEEQANAVRACEPFGVFEELGQGGAGPGRDHIKGLNRGRFHPAIVDGDGQVHGLGRSFEESAFLGGGLEQGNGNPAAQHLRQDQPRKAGAGAHIRQGASFGGDEGGELGGIPEMPPPKVIQGASGDQIMQGIPFAQDPGIGLQPGQCFT